MDLCQSLSTTQNQKLVLTPELKQSLKILQYNQFELQAYIEEILLENPLLELNRTNNFDSLKFHREKIPKTYPSSFEYGSNDGALYTGSTPSKDSDIPDDYKYYDQLHSSQTLWEYLISQLGCMKLSHRSKMIIRILINYIDENGYMTTNLTSLSETLSLPIDVLEVGLDLIQHMEPVGVGARSLEECLKIQFETFKEDTQLAEAIIHHSLEDLGNNRLSKIAKDHKISIEKVKEGIRLIKKTNPKPGARFKTPMPTPFIQPDVIVEWKDNQLQLIINETYTCPRLSLSSNYEKMLKDKDTSLEVRSFLHNKKISGQQLIHNIEQRKKTIETVTKAIVNYQNDFFSHPNHGLKPMRLEDIASLVGLHISTVSRAISNKYLQCSQGTFPMKYFFQSGFKSFKGQDASTEEIKNRIMSIIHEENPKTPVSDQKIADLLASEEICVSRRTVAKYRDHLGIQSSCKRKQY